MDLRNILSILSAIGAPQMPPVDPSQMPQAPVDPSQMPQDPANVLQQLAQPPQQQTPAPMPQAPQMNAPAAEPPKRRRSLLDTIGRVSDVFAKVGGAEALYQPTLDAREDRMMKGEDRQRDIEMDGLKLATGKFALGDAQNERLGQFARGLKAIGAGGGDINQALPVLAQRMGLDPETVQSVQQEISTNPNALDGLIAATSEPRPSGSPSTAVQNYTQYQQILQEQGPEAAEQFMRFAQPEMTAIKPYQQAQISLDERRLQRQLGQDNIVNRREDQRLALEAEKLANSPMTARERADIRKLQMSMPKISSSFRAATRAIDRQIQDARKLRDHPGLAGITGAIQGRIPISVLPTSNAAQALLDQISAQGTFGELQKMRNNSPTGGALGNVSDAEGKRLQAAFARLSQAQSEKDFQAGLDDYIADLEFSRENINLAYEESRELISRLTSERPAAPGRSTPDRNNGGGIPTVNPAEAKKLPSGTRFRTTDGRVLVRP